MTEDAAASGVIDPAKELNALHDKRVALKRAVSIAHMVERLHHGLQAVLLLGKPTRDISHEALQQFEELSYKTRILPTDKLTHGLKLLDKVVHERLQSIVKIANSSAADDSILEHTEALLTDFRRKAQTAVALRVLLLERGVPTKPLDLPVPRQQLREQLISLAQRELACRQRIKHQLLEMRADVERIINSAHCPEAIRQIVESVSHEIEINLQHIEAGKTIEKMPIAIEFVEMGSDEPSFTEASSTTTAPPPRADKPETNVAQTTPQPSTDESLVEIERGVTERLAEWMSSPWSHKWSEIAKTKKVPSKD